MIVTQTIHASLTSNMGTGASELQKKGNEEPDQGIKVVKKTNLERDSLRSGQRDKIIRRKERKAQADSKDIANIFNLPPLPASEGPYSDAEFDPKLRISSDSDDSLMVRVSVSPGELKKRKIDDISLSNLSLDDGPSRKELDSLTSEIDVALEGHDDVMKDIRGVYFIHSVTSRGSADLPLKKSNCSIVRPKGSTIEPLPGLIPVRVNWSASEKLTEQEKILHQKMESMKPVDESANQCQEGFLSHETDRPMREESKKEKSLPIEEELTEPQPKPIIIRFEYTEEELELMRSIEREYGEYGERYQKMF